MHLKKIELSGFKSFANYSALEFSSGITAIVGPNGSGKSNIADAIRWILGEQSMRNIRSQSSKDLIFSGSKNRSKLGKATVELWFDNRQGGIPLDFEEVIITRNIFRDSTSEYFINKRPVKQMDVVEIFAKANIGHRGFSVINQGMESEILKYSPSELYELLEEASGVRYLQLKKQRSERRLKITETNLEKGSSILAELVPHLRYLKREATKAERREKMKESLRELQKQFFFVKIIDSEKQKEELGKQKENFETKISKLKKEIAEFSEQLQKEENTIKEGREKFINAQKELEKILDERAQLSDKLADLRAKIQIERASQPVQKKQINIDLRRIEEEFKYIHLTLSKILELEDLTKVRSEISKILSRVEKIIGKEDLPARHWPEPQAMAGGLEKVKKSIEELLSKISQKYEEQKNVFATSQKQLNQEKFFETERTLRRKKDELSDLENKTKEDRWVMGQIEENYKNLRQNISNDGLDYDEIKRGENINKTNEPVEELERKIGRLKYQIEEIGSVDELTLQEYKETKERYTKLSKKLEDLKKAKQNLGGLIKQLTKEIQEQFGKNFQAINDNFNKYFRLLFSGGRAYLKQITNYPAQGWSASGGKSQISNQDEKVESGEEKISEEELEMSEPETEEEQTISKGLEIRATLPKKKVNNLRMFSGGEKALTSIALLFAIISSNPPPFLVLDEVDATLDENNSLRFARLLKEFSQGTQFVIITHNREIMNQADILYGITMGTDGVSKLLSLKLEK